MGSGEEVKVSKPEKPSSPATDQNNAHVYPDWATMQAYYGPRLAVPPYMNSAVGSPHTTPPYMWGQPQSMIPPYGAPYAAFYAHPGVYAHPSVTVASTPLSMDTPFKPAGNGDGGFTKKLKEFDGLTRSIGNGNDGNTKHGNDQKMTDSEDTEGSSDGSNGATPRANRDGKKRSRESSPNSENDKPEKKSNSSAEKTGNNQDFEKKVDLKPVKTIMDNTNTALDLTGPNNVSLHPVPPEIWLQNERELKKERRKQSNRDSARRSRLRKQAEAEQLAAKVQLLNAEKMNLKFEISQLMENSEKLRHENAALMEKLRNSANPRKIDGGFVVLKKPVGTVNLLERVNNSSESTEGTEEEEDENGDQCVNASPKAKLHQLLDASPRSDAAVAAR